MARLEVTNGEYMVVIDCGWPEAIPRDYYPDNHPVAYSYNGHTLTLTQVKRNHYRHCKGRWQLLSADKNEVTILHRLINQSSSSIELSIWSSLPCRCWPRIMPQEPYGEAAITCFPNLWCVAVCKNRPDRAGCGAKLYLCKAGTCFYFGTKIVS